VNYARSNHDGVMFSAELDAHDPQRTYQPTGDGAEQSGPGRHRGWVSCASGRQSVTWKWPRCDNVCLDHQWDDPTLLCARCAREAAAVSWDQIITWIIMPLAGSVLVGGGALWLSRYIP
jgi:hypothetical protein